MGKTRNTGFSNNAIQYNSGSIAFVSGSTTLLNISSSGNIVTTGTITANTLVIQTVTSSVSFVTGSTKFGSINSNTHQFTGSLLVSGSSTALNINNGALFVSSSGFIGIGVTGSTTPVRLSVSGAIESLTDGGGEGGQITLRGNTFQYGIDNFNGTGVRIIRENDGTGAAGAVLMFISGSGNVGIGTTSPSSPLHVVGTTTINGDDGSLYQRAVTAGAAVYWDIRTSANARRAFVGFGGTSSSTFTLNNNENGDLVFGTNNQTKFRLFANGRASFNNATDRGYQFMVSGDVSSYACEIRQSNDAPNYDLLTLTHEGTSGNRRMVIFNTGGIGTVGTIISTNSSTTYNTNSDYRLKQDLKDFKGLDIVDSIKTYDFEWKVDNTRSYGVLAHELQEVLPYIVYGEKDGEHMQGVDYSKIVPVLVKAIQELKAENDALKTRIETLENK